MNGASSRGCSGGISLQKKSAACCMEAKYRIDLSGHWFILWQIKSVWLVLFD
jgi:hypothetical protein